MCVSDRGLGGAVSDVEQRSTQFILGDDFRPGGFRDQSLEIGQRLRLRGVVLLTCMGMYSHHD